MKIGTHNGRFHTDEAAAIALLLRIYPDAEIIRSRDPQVLEACEIIVDVGGVHDPLTCRFDHHQKGGAGEWPDDGTTLSSFGLVWQHYCFQLGVSSKTLEMIERTLVVPVDARDNGQQPERRARDIPSIADFVDSLNSAWNEAIDENAAFMEAVTFVGRHLQRLIVRGEAQMAAAEFVRSAITNAENPRLIVLDQGLPWHELVITETSEAEFVVLPGQPGSGEWLVQAIPVELGKQQPFRRPLPKSWGGLSGQKLVEVTGVADAKFAHNQGYIAIAHSKEGALALAKLALDT
jgi:uncharacterized UPF0160 family protein